MIPVITTQPIAKIVKSGASTTLSVVATGGSLSYQWKKDNVIITGATSASYSISPTGPDKAGVYTVVVTNIDGNVTSNPARLTVLFAPVIVTQPASLSVTANREALFQVTINANPTPTFQWKKGGQNLANSNSAIYKIASTLTTDAVS